MESCWINCRREQFGMQLRGDEMRPKPLKLHPYLTKISSERLHYMAFVLDGKATHRTPPPPPNPSPWYLQRSVVMKQRGSKKSILVGEKAPKQLQNKKIFTDRSNALENTLVLLKRRFEHKDLHAKLPLGLTCQ